MSVFAGIYSLRQGANGLTPEAACQEAIVRAISRANDRVETWSNERFFLAKIDVGVFPQPAMLRPEDESRPDAVAAIAGHPYLAASHEPSTSRQAHLTVMSRDLCDDRIDVLRDCFGVFALCHYRLSDGRLLLSTDRAGSRPVYYYVGRDYLYFSTALRVLEAMPVVPKRMDIQGVAERIALGFPLGPRTQYADIRVLENGQYLRGEDGNLRCESYFAWDQIAPTTSTNEQLLDQAYDAFLAAVARRSADQEVCVANLSGGLDSRCVVTALHALGKDVYTITWAMDGFLDTILARQFAEKLHLKQVMRPLSPLPGLEDLLACFSNLQWPDAPMPPRPNLIFSGDGGSVGLGHVYLTEECVTWMRTGQTRRVIDILATGLPRRTFHKSWRDKMQDALTEGVKTEFQRIHSHDPGRDLHIFYMKNDQRRHLYRRYENIDICRVEYLLPFLDGPFLERILGGPLDAFLFHRFYNQWLDRFPAVIKSVPWQSYPGHVPCPIPLNTEGRNQWELTRKEQFGGKYRRAMRRCARTLFHKDFPADFIRRGPMLAVLLLHALHLRNCGGCLTTCAEFCDTSSKCGGVMVLPGEMSD